MKNLLFIFLLLVISCSQYIDNKSEKSVNIQMDNRKENSHKILEENEIKINFNLPSIETETESKPEPELYKESKAIYETLPEPKPESLHENGIETEPELESKPETYEEEKSEEENREEEY